MWVIRQMVVFLVLLVMIGVPIKASADEQRSTDGQLFMQDEGESLFMNDEEAGAKSITKLCHHLDMALICELQKREDIVIQMFERPQNVALQVMVPSRLRAGLQQMYFGLTEINSPRMLAIELWNQRLRTALTVIRRPDLLDMMIVRPIYLGLTKIHSPGQLAYIHGPRIEVAMLVGPQNRACSSPRLETPPQHHPAVLSSTSEAFPPRNPRRRQPAAASSRRASSFLKLF